MDPVIDIFPEDTYDGVVSGNEDDIQSNCYEPDPNTAPIDIEPVSGSGNNQFVPQGKAMGRGAGILSLLPGLANSEGRRKGIKRPSAQLSQKRKKHRSVCPIEGCQHASPKLRWHVYHHLPQFFRPQEEHTGLAWQRVLSYRAQALRQIAVSILGSSNLNNLLKYTQDNWMATDSPLSENDRAEIALLIKNEGWELVIPSLTPVNTPAVLTHWRPLAFLWGKLTDDVRNVINNPQLDAAAVTKPGTSTPATTNITPMAHGQRGSGELLQGFDSHFHPDRMADMKPTLIPGRKPDHAVEVTGGVLNYCDPEVFCRPGFEEDVLGEITGQNWKVAIGIHPKEAANYTPAQWERFLALLHSPRVSAISELGFDFSVPDTLWCHQEELFDRIISMGTLGRVLVMHLRGSKDDQHSSVVNRLAMRRLKVKCYPQYQRVHLHSFTGDVRIVKAWLTKFPHTYFGISGLVKSFDGDQLQAVKEIPLNRLLLETDSPHLKVHDGCRYNTPNFLADVGQQVALVRGMALSELMRATYENARRLYW